MILMYMSTQKKQLTHDKIIILLKNKINQTDFNNAKKDILPFIIDSDAVTLWSYDQPATPYARLVANSTFKGYLKVVLLKY